ILYVARWGLPWHAVPPGLGMAHGKTCWRRLDEWTRLGIWDAILEALLASGVKKLQLERVLVDATMVSAKKGLDDGPQPHRSRETFLQNPSFDGRPRGAVAGAGVG